MAAACVSSRPRPIPFTFQQSRPRLNSYARLHRFRRRSHARTWISAALPRRGHRRRPERARRGVYNNALLARDLATAERADAIDAVEAAYVTARVTRFAAWVHESDQAMRGDWLWIRHQ